MAQRIVKTLVGAALIMALPLLSSDWIPVVIGAVACAYLATYTVRKTTRKTSDLSYVFGGIFGALLSLYLYATVLGSVRRLDLGSALAGIVCGILVGAGVALITSTMTKRGRQDQMTPSYVNRRR